MDFFALPPADAQSCEESLRRLGWSAAAQLTAACEILAPRNRQLAEAEQMPFAKFDKASDYLDVAIAIGCVVGAAFASGLTMAMVR